MASKMNYHMAMQEAYTTSNVTRTSWEGNTYVWKGSFLWDKPFYEDDGVTVAYTLPFLYAGYIKKVDGVDTVYTPTEDDESATDWDYWNPTYN